MFVADSIREVYAQTGSAAAFRMRYFALPANQNSHFPAPQGSMRNGEGRFALQGPPDSAKLGMSIRKWRGKAVSAGF